MISFAWLTGQRFHIGLIALGIFLRARHYFENRSFWQDELCLALSIVNRSLQEIWQHLLLFPDFAQAPLIFQVIEKAFSGAFGNNEMALRLFPFLTSLAALFIAWRFFRRLLQPVAATLALALFALSDPLVYFAAELKPYGVDVLAALVMYEVIINLRRGWNLTRVMALAFVGAGMIWFSYAMLFVLAGCGAILLYENIVRRDWRRMLEVSFCFLVWLLSFVFLYKLSLAKMLNPDLVKNWHLAGGFAPGTFLSLEGLAWLGKSFLNMFRMPLGLNWPWLMASFLVWGAAVLFRRDRMMAGLLLMPLLLVMAAAAFEKYPFFERLILFLVPGLLVVLATGVEDVMARVAPYGKAAVVLVAGILFIFPLSVAVGHAVVARGQEQNREAMEYIAAHYQPDDEIVISNQAQYPFWYYGQKLGLIRKLKLQPVPGGGVAAWTLQLFPDSVRQEGHDFLAMRRGLGVYDDEGYYRKLFFLKASEPFFISAENPDALKGMGRVWVFLSHHNTPSYPGFIDKAFSRAGKKLQSFERPGAAVFLYQL